MQAALRLEFGRFHGQTWGNITRAFWPQSTTRIHPSGHAGATWGVHSDAKTLHTWPNQRRPMTRTENIQVQIGYHTILPWWAKQEASYMYSFPNAWALLLTPHLCRSLQSGFLFPLQTRQQLQSRDLSMEGHTWSHCLNTKSPNFAQSNLSCSIHSLCALGTKPEQPVFCAFTQRMKFWHLPEDMLEFSHIRISRWANSTDWFLTERLLLPVWPGILGCLQHKRRQHGNLLHARVVKGAKAGADPGFWSGGSSRILTPYRRGPEPKLKNGLKTAWLWKKRKIGGPGAWYLNQGKRLFSPRRIHVVTLKPNSQRAAASCSRIVTGCSRELFTNWVNPTHFLVLPYKISGDVSWSRMSLVRMGTIQCKHNFQVPVLLL